MIITLNSELTETIPSRVLTVDYFAENAKTQLALGYHSEVRVVKPIEMAGAEYQTGFLGMIATAYSNHTPVAIAPHDIWFMLMTEVAKVIRDNVEASRSLFTISDSRIEIAVETTDPTDLTANLDKFEEKLRKLVPVDIDAFIPKFSTDTVASRLATMAAFMDGVQHYYEYMMFCCGIPAIKILGTIDDWQLAKARFSEIAAMFESVGVDISAWLARVDSCFDNILSSLNGEDRSDWWSQIFTQTKVGSGGQLKIDGWIVGLYYKQAPGLIETFGYSWATVPFKNLHEPDKDYRSIHGPFKKVRDSDGFVYCEYADATIIAEKAVRQNRADIVTKEIVDRQISKLVFK